MIINRSAVLMTYLFLARTDTVSNLKAVKLFREACQISMLKKGMRGLTLS